MFKSHVNAYQTVTSTEENFYNHVDWMMYSVATSQPLTPATPVIAQWSYEHTPMVAGKEVMYLLSNVDFHSSSPTCPLLSAPLASSRDQY